jgi:mRNA interferase RelE/StbE
LKEKYSLRVSALAEKQLKAVPPDDQARLLRSMRGLSQDPRPRGCRKLHGSLHTYRIRVGYYRVVYSIEDGRLLVLVIKLGHRKDIYR